MLKGARGSLAELALYFLRLGATGFGGPVALAEAMRRDLVGARGWITHAEYETGLALAAACPGPLAYQLGVYFGYLRRGVAGALVVALCFAAAPFLLVVAVAAGYVHLAGSGILGALFRGVGPVILALIVKSCGQLGRTILRRDPGAWALAVVAAVLTVHTEKDLTVLFVLAGLLGSLLFAGVGAAPASPAAGRGRGAATASGFAFLGGLPFAMGAGLSARLFLFFFKAGCLIFGSGLVIVPFLKAYVVDEYHWLSDRMFLDAVAVGMLSPGPVVITATFVGYVVNGIPGAVAATLGIFSPAVIFTLLAAPLLERHGSHRRLQGFVRGVSIAVVGVLAGTTVLVARATLTEGLAIAEAVACLAVLMAFPRVREPALVGLGAVVGLASRAAGY